LPSRLWRWPFTGIYSVVVYSVSQRAREVGIRIALGASRGSIVRLLMVMASASSSSV